MNINNSNSNSENISNNHNNSNNFKNNISIIDSKTAYINSINTINEDNLNGYMKELYDKVNKTINTAIQNHMTECIVKDYFYKNMEEQKICINHIIQILKLKGYTVEYNEKDELVPNQKNIEWYLLKFYTYFILKINFKQNAFFKIKNYIKTIWKKLFL